jgi:hypothetical protein
MKKHIPLILEQNRILDGDYGSTSAFGMAGAFRILGPAPNYTALAVMSSGPDSKTGWEHVSVSAQKRCPTWEEMCFVKDIFWSEHEMVVQYHPPASEYVNFHPGTLHLWKHSTMAFPMPPSLLVGPKERIE